MATEIKFQATARIPTRPLAFTNENKLLACKKELLVDYENHELYICVEAPEGDTSSDVVDGKKFYNVTASVTSVVEQIKTEIINDLNKPTDPSDPNYDPDSITNVIKNITIVIPDPDGGEGTKVTINDAILDALAKIEGLKENLGLITDESGNVVWNPTESSIPSSAIQETDDKKFVSDSDIESWYKKTDTLLIDNITVSKNTGTSGNDVWIGTAAPYKQVINVTDMKETYYPVVDVKLSSAYETAMKELDSYSYIYKITTHNGYIEVYAMQPTEVALTLIMKIDHAGEVPTTA